MPAVARRRQTPPKRIKELAAEFAWVWDKPERADKLLYGVKSYACQMRVRKALRQHRFYSLASANGTGKSAVIIPTSIIDYMLSHYPCKVLLTGATWQSVRKTVYPRLCEIASRLAAEYAPLIHPPTATGWTPFGPNVPVSLEIVSTDSPASIQGRHEANVLVVVDEASSLAQAMMAPLESFTKSPTSCVWLFGNPIVDSGPYYDTHHRLRGVPWYADSLSAMESPNFGPDGVIQPDMPSPDSVALDALRWGEDSFEYQSRVLAQWPTQGTMSVVTRRMIEDAVKRWQGEGATVGKRVLGIDTGIVSDGDPTVWIARDSARTLTCEEMRTDSPDALLAESKRIIAEVKPDAIYIDAQGAPYLPGQLQALGYPVTAIRFGSEAHDAKTYGNQRAEMFFTLRGALRQGGFAIEPEIGKTLADQAVIQRKATTNGLILIEPKDEIKKRIGRSTDHLDALALTFVEPPGEKVFDSTPRELSSALCGFKPIVWREKGARLWSLRLENWPLPPRDGELMRGIWFAPRGPSACLWFHKDKEGTITLFDALEAKGRVLARDFMRDVVARSRDEDGRPHEYTVDAKSVPQDRLPELDQTVCDELDRAIDLAHAARGESKVCQIPLNVEPGRLAGLAGWGEIMRMVDNAGKDNDQLLIWPREVWRAMQEARYKPDKGDDLETDTVGGGGALMRALRLVMVCWGDLR